jgi:hypothetical protein
MAAGSANGEDRCRHLAEGRIVIPRLASLIAASVLLVGQHTAAAQTPGNTDALFEGVWQARWAQAVRTQADGSFEVQRWGEGELEIRAVADGVEARWTTEVVERVTWSLVGSPGSDRLVLRSTGHDSDNAELDVVERLEMHLLLAGDHLEGELRMHFRGRSRPPSPRPITAKRTR